MRKIVIICMTLMLVSLVYSTGAANNGEIPFESPEKGGGMAHCDQKMSDYINMPVPEEDVKIVWHKYDGPGEYGGSKGLGFVSNGEIAAASYSGLSNNLIIYDYNGYPLWKSGGVSISKEKTPVQSQMRFPILTKLIDKIREKVNAPFLKKLIEIFLT